MSFIELYGGEWGTKSELSAGDALRFLTLIPKLKLSPKFIAKMGSFGATGKPVKSTLTEEGDGVYKVFVEMGEMTSESRFTIDGKPTENYRMFDNRKIMISCTFVDGVWTTETESEGCMKVVNIAKREGDIINMTEKYGDIEIHKVTKKYEEYQDK